MKKICSILLAVIMIAAAGTCGLRGLFCRAARGEEADPVAIRVGKYTYPISLVQFSMRSAADQNGLLWETLETEQKEAIRDAVIEQYIGIGIIENKLAEQGKHDFSEAEEEQIRAYAQQQYDENWNSLYDYLKENGLNVTKARVSEWVDGRGYTLDRYYESALAAERQFRMFEIYCEAPKMTGDEINNRIIFYPEEYANPLTIVEQPVSTRVAEGETAEFSVTAAGGVPPYSYQWQNWDGEELGWQDLPGRNADTLVFINAQTEQNGMQPRSGDNRGTRG